MGWFEEEYVDRAIEVENRRKEIYGLPPMNRSDIKRSDYWYKAHGGKAPQKVSKHTPHEFVEQLSFLNDLVEREMKVKG